MIFRKFGWVLLTLAAAGTAHAADSEGAKPEGLGTEGEAGIVIAGGNAKSQSYNFKDVTAYSFSGNVFKLGGHYLSTTSNGTQSALNWDLGLRYERLICDGLSAYLGQNVEADVFGGYTQRYNTDVGAKYQIIKEENLSWSVEAGYRLSIQNDLFGSQRTDHLLRAYTEATRSWTKTFAIKYWLEVLPNLTQTDAYRINMELSGIATLSSIFSLKVGYGIRFNNQPPSGAVYKTDTVFTTALVAKLTPDEPKAQ